MKTVSVLFPDSTHGKFAVKPGDTFEHLFTKACTKRELDTAHHEMAVNKRAVPLEQVVDADALADAEVKVRVKRHSMMESGLRALGLSANAPIQPQPAHAVAPRKTERWCGFCGTVIGDENLQEFGAARFHAPSCFKCSHCFCALSAGSKVFPDRHDANQPVCETCTMQQHAAKQCLRCGESVRGCFVATFEKGDVHVECMVCCLCKDSLLVSGHVEKDGEMLCTAHRALKPLKDPAFKRPKKIGHWKGGEMCLLRLGSSGGFKWRQGVVQKVHNFVADVQVDGVTHSVNVSDLLVTHKAVAVKQAQKELRRGKLVSGEPPTMQRDNSLAHFVRANSLPRNPKSGTATASRSPMTTAVADSGPAQSQVKPEKSEKPEKQELPHSLVGPAAPALRYCDDEEVVFRLSNDGEWIPGMIVTGDAEVEDGPFYLVSYGEGQEELVAQKDIRRLPFYRVGDRVEAKWADDGQFYAAEIAEVIDETGHTYLVNFTEYGNTQQCTADFLRPAFDSPQCAVCHGPSEIVDGACYFCGALADEEEGGGKAAEAAKRVEKEDNEADVAEAEAERVEQETVHVSKHRHKVPVDEPAALDNDPAALRAQIESLTRENAGLRERLNEAIVAQQRSEAEVEALRAANKATRLRQSHAAHRGTATASDAAVKPLPAPPGAVARRAVGILRDSSASQVGAGRGKSK